MSLLMQTDVYSVYKPRDHVMVYNIHYTIYTLNYTLYTLYTQHFKIG